MNIQNTEPNYPDHLKINGREKLPNSSFEPNDKLYRDFDKDDLDNNYELQPNSVSFPDISCNWGRFSYPEDVKFRKNGSHTNGCYSITVENARYENIATPVHAPLDEDDYENYSHTEIRELYGNETIDFQPPPIRKKKTGKRRRSEYRQYFIDHIDIEFSPS